MSFKTFVIVMLLLWKEWIVKLKKKESEKNISG